MSFNRQLGLQKIASEEAVKMLYCQNDGGLDPEVTMAKVMAEIEENVRQLEELAELVGNPVT